MSALAVCCEERNGLENYTFDLWSDLSGRTGRKTQLACIGLACRTRSPLAVFLGSVGALAAVTLVGVVFGEALANLVPVAYIRKASGALFVVIGAAILVSG